MKKKLIILCVGAGKSGSGKTTFICNLLKYLKLWGACKITIKKEIKGFIIESKKDNLLQKGKDTERYLKSGAKKVLWIKSDFNSLKKAYNKVIKKFNCLEGVIFEGNSLIKLIKPDISVMILKNNKNIKESAKEILSEADFILRTPCDKKMTQKILLKIKNLTS